MSKALQIKKNDQVLVIAGKEKGKTGKVLRVIPEKNRVIIERVNFIKKHQKPTQRQKRGGIIEKEGSIDVSNVMLLCTKCDKPTRTGIHILPEKKKVRVCKNCGEIVDK